MAEKEKGKRSWMEAFLFSLIGFASPELMKGAKRMVAGVPKNHWLRSETTARATGVARELIEEFSEKFGVAGKAAGALFGDFLEFAGKELYSGNGGKSDVSRAAEDWMDAFFKDAGERLKKSPTPKLTARDIKEEFRLRVAILRKIEKAREAAEPKEEEKEEKEEQKPINRKREWKKFKKLVGNLNNQLESAAKPLARKLKRMEG